MIVAGLALVLVVPAASAGPTTQIVSRSTGGEQANGESLHPDISRDGNLVSFFTPADNLDPNDKNGNNDVYVRDMAAGVTTIASISTSGVRGDGNSLEMTMSAPGRYLVFDTNASNLIDGRTFPPWRIPLRDRKAGTTTLASVNSSEQPVNKGALWHDISANGRSVVFASAATNVTAKPTYDKSQIFLRDRKLGKTFLISKRSTGKPGKQPSYDPEMSANGRVIVFVSEAKNLVARDTNGKSDVFKYDRVTRKTSRVSLNQKGKQLTGGKRGSRHPDVSADGRYLVFQSEATNAIPAETGSRYQIYRRDLRTAKIKLVSRNSGGVPANGWSEKPRISSNGKWVVFESTATDLLPGVDDNGDTSDIFRRGLY
jgi:Tol biopolymer transport system component